MCNISKSSCELCGFSKLFMRTRVQVTVSDAVQFPLTIHHDKINETGKKNYS